MATNNWDWVFHTLGWTLAGLGVLLALWALFWDRSRGRRRCPKCWYLMEGAVAGDDGSLTCPECGKKITAVRKLTKTRRRWRRVAVAVIPFWAASVTYRVNWPGREGLMAAVPTTALVLFVTNYEAQNKLTLSLVERLRREPIAPWDRWLAIRSEAAAMPDDWSFAVMHRAKWPEGTPMRVKINPKMWMWSQFTGRNTTMWLKGDETNVASYYHQQPGIFGFITSTPPDWIDLPAPALGVNRYTLVFENHTGSKRLARQEVEIVVEGVETIGEVIQPFKGAALPLRSMLQWSLRHDPSFGDSTIDFRAEDFYSRIHATRYKVTLSKGDSVIGVARSGVYGSAGFPIVLENEKLTGVIDFENHIFFLDGLTIKVESDLEGALLDLDHDTYWNGGFEMPLRSLPFMGYDRLNFTSPFLIQADEIPLDVFNNYQATAAETEWLRKNAVKQPQPK